MARRYDDGGYSRGTLDRPDLQKSFEDVENAKTDCVVVYKIDSVTSRQKQKKCLS